MVMSGGEKVFDDTPKNVFRHYKELEAIGLSAPQVTYIVQRLRENGVNISEDLTTVAEAKDAILKLLKDKGKLGAVSGGNADAGRNTGAGGNAGAKKPSGRKGAR